MKQNWKTVWKAADHFPLSVEETEIQDKTYKVHRVVLHQGKSGAVIIIRKNDSIAFVEQYRVAIDQKLLELPRGIGEDNDLTSVDTAIREAKEETGIIVKNAVEIGTMYADSGLLANPIGIVMAEYESQIQQTDGEIDHLEWIAIKDINNYIKESKIIDGISITAMYQYFLKEK